MKYDADAELSADSEEDSVFQVRGHDGELKSGSCVRGRTLGRSGQLVVKESGHRFPLGVV